jgi:hypothetical protein
MPESICVKNTQSPGDHIVLSASLRDIALCYPGVFQFHVSTPEPDIWRNNPWVTFGEKRGIRKVVAKYSSPGNPYRIHQSNQHRAHFLWSFLADLNIMLGTQAVLTDFRPALYLTEEEKATPLLQLDKPYWVMVAGGKRDFTAKWWDKARWQQVVNRIKNKVVVVQVGGGSHIHPPLEGVHNLVARTSFRELMRLIYHSHGVMCIVTCLMHLAAAFNKPCVTVAGSREPWWWEAYNEESRLINMKIGFPDWKPPMPDLFIPHRYIWNECTLPQWKEGRGCWKGRLEGGDPCKHVVSTPTGLRLPYCLDQITADRVVKEFDWYYEQGILSLNQKIFAAPLEAAVKKEQIQPRVQPYVSKPKPEYAVRSGLSHLKTLNCDVIKPAPEVKLERTQLFVYVDNFHLDYLVKVRERSPGAALTVVCNGSIPELVDWCKHNAAESISDGNSPGRPALFHRAIIDSKREQLVWLEYPVLPRSRYWGSYLTDFPQNSFGGCFYWQRMNDGNKALIRSIPYAGKFEMRQHGIDGAPIAIFPLRGYFVFAQRLVPNLEWVCQHAPDARLELMLGVQMQQLGMMLRDMGHTVEHQ